MTPAEWLRAKRQGHSLGKLDEECLRSIADRLERLEAALRYVESGNPLSLNDHEWAIRRARETLTACSCVCSDCVEFPCVAYVMCQVHWCTECNGFGAVSHAPPHSAQCGSCNGSGRRE